MTDTSSPRNGADALCDTLLAGGIDTCFANPGTSEMHFVAALDRKPQMRCVLGMFEGVVTGAADGYARMADKPAVTLLHLGPGLANGLANLHNARRANTPMINVVGDHATYHLQYDAPLTADIESLARPMSHWVKRIGDADAVSSSTAEAIAVAGTGAGRIATLILPADAAWNDTAVPLAKVTPALSQELQQPAQESVHEAVRMIRSGKRTALMLSGRALRERGLEAAGRIAQATGIRLLAQQSNARMERGAGRVAIERVPYAVDQAVEFLADVDQLILVGAKAPVGFFAYPGKPSVMTPPDCTIFELASPDQDGTHALEWLADALDAGTVAADVASFVRPELPSGGLTAAAIMTALAALMPENAILCDESVTSGRTLFSFTRNAPPHDYLQLTGGAIGLGLPMAAGAAIACPDRKVICLEADGSGMYTVQALWTQAREKLDVVTILFSNRSYAILHGELKSVGAGTPGRNARRMLDLDDPALDWVKLASGMGVEAVRATTAEEFNQALRRAISMAGPQLIEAVI
jgi:acetolactate synthase-1/2/3 large subunit